MITQKDVRDVNFLIMIIVVKYIISLHIIYNPQKDVELFDLIQVGKFLALPFNN